MSNRRDASTEATVNSMPGAELAPIWPFQQRIQQFHQRARPPNDGLGYPSSGGILVIYTTLVDLLYLSLSRFEPCQSSPNIKDEDEFCDRMRRIGAGWWSSETNWAEAEFGLREKTAKEKEKLVFGWPEDGSGVWVLRFLAPDDVPRNFGMLDFGMNMSEKIHTMRSFGAEYVEEARMAEFGISPPASNASTRGAAS
nr:hypothetical protein B0A51_06384 [Rachicladosporium sp. CCFEE 5018]